MCKVQAHYIDFFDDMNFISLNPFFNEGICPLAMTFEAFFVEENFFKPANPTHPFKSDLCVKCDKLIFGFFINFSTPLFTLFYVFHREPVLGFGPRRVNAGPAIHWTVVKWTVIFVMQETNNTASY
jgi:hypothetical protein